MSTGPPSSQPVHVAAGIIRDAAGRVLVNQRQPGKPFAGRWEFPGGKIDPGETAAQALVRELDEELGIAVRRQRPLISFPYRYDELAVRLCVNEVLEYQGVPSGREGQALHWAPPDALGEIDLLAANAVIVRAIVLPRICLITDTGRFGAERTLALLAQHVRGQRVLLIVREKTMDREPLDSFIRRAREICLQGESLICVHADCDFDGHDLVDGIHLPARVLEQAATRHGTGLIGISCHSESELRLANERGAAYALLSPVKPTASHPSAQPLGWARFQALCRPAPMPVYALGGMTDRDFNTAVDHGAQGVAMLGAAWQ